MAYRRTPRIEARLEEKRFGIVSAALTLVAERGYGGCRVSEVAKVAHVGTGTVYRHFASKGDLFAEVYRTACTREIAAATDAMREAVGPCSCSQLVAGVEVFARRSLKAPTLAFAMLVEPVDPLVEAERLAYRRAWADLFSVALRECVPAADVEVTATSLVGAVAESLIAPLSQQAPAPEVVPGLIRFTRRSLGGEHAHHA